MIASSNFFKNMCDELVLNKDEFELDEQLKWIEEESRKRGIDTYEFIFLILNKYDVDEKAKKWRATKEADGSC